MYKIYHSGQTFISTLKALYSSCPHAEGVHGHVNQKPRIFHLKRSQKPFRWTQSPGMLQPSLPNKVPPPTPIDSLSINTNTLTSRSRLLHMAIPSKSGIFYTSNDRTLGSNSTNRSCSQPSMRSISSSGSFGLPWLFRRVGNEMSVLMVVVI